MPIPFALDPLQRKEAARMYLEEKLSARQIAEHFEVSTNAARNALKSEGVQFREKFAARQLRYVPQPAPEPVYRRVNSVFQLGAQT